MKLGEKIIKIRKENGLSQEEFGNKIKVSRQAVSKWENEEAIPDTEKIQEIVKVFNVSYEYLLNDEIDDIEKITRNSGEKEKKIRIKKYLKIILIIFIIYLLICAYKFITFYRFFTAANSFSEKDYWISQNTYLTINEVKNNIIFYTTRVGDKTLETSYSQSDVIKDENGKNIPYSITYTDINKKEAYNLYYNKDKGKYIYDDMKNDMINEEEIENLFMDKNKIKENTLDNIPSSFEEMIFASINPMIYYVDIANREIRWYSITNQVSRKVKLSKDYLLERVNIETKSDEGIDITYSYDYVQDHYKEIEDPLETYANKIIFEEEI